MKKYYKKGEKTRYYLILILIVLLITSIGYAVFTEQLDISGTVSGSANFKVYFAEATVTDSTKGTATINNDEDTVTFTVSLSYPGDRVLIGTKIKNESSVAVKLNDFTIKKVDGTSRVDIDNTADIKIDYEALDTTTEVLDSNEICDYRFVIYWDSYENQTVTTPESQTFEITLNYEQDPTTQEVEKLHTHGTVPSGGEEEPPVSTEWTQTGTTVTNGEVTLEVGQAVTGYEANGVDGWYVLGAENGKLLITTNTNVGENVLLAGKDGYTDGLDILNTAVVNYKDANLADNVRIINGDDLNRVTGFSPEGTNLGQVSEYGNEVTYYWDGTSNPYYSTTNQLSGSGSTSHSGGFYYPTESGWECSPVSTTASEESKEIITTLTSTYYYYYANSFLATDNPAYTLLFANTGAYPGDTGTYWLGSKYVSCTNSSANFGFRGVINGGVHTNGVAFTSGAHNGHSMGLRPVVTLKSSVNVTSEGVITND